MQILFRFLVIKKYGYICLWYFISFIKIKLYNKTAYTTEIWDMSTNLVKNSSFQCQWKESKELCLMFVCFTVHQNIARYFWQNILRYFLLIYSSYNIENIGCPGFSTILPFEIKCISIGRNRVFATNCNRAGVVEYSHSVTRASCSCTKKGAWSIINDQ